MTLPGNGCRVIGSWMMRVDALKSPARIAAVGTVLLKTRPCCSRMPS